MKKAAILGSGKIGCDLLCKIQDSKKIQCEMFVGRRKDSPGVRFARAFGVTISVNGIEDIINNKENIDIVFDATSAKSHLSNRECLLENNFKVINLTPAAMGFKCIPSINLDDVKSQHHVSMITCGGQASIPIIYAATQALSTVKYIEVVTTISAKSAGPATRYNIGEYQEITEQSISYFSGCSDVKSILVINPAEPPIVMQTCIYILADTNKLEDVVKSVKLMEKKVQQYMPGFQVMQEPSMDDGRIFIILRVYGKGDYLPVYAGNLDIITSAAVKVAEALG